jgi:PAS domain S-box-containing protein
MPKSVLHRLEVIPDAGEELLRPALAAASIGDWSWDAGENVLALSEAASAILGVRTRIVLSWAELCSYLGPSDAERARHAVKDILAGGTSRAFECRVRSSSDGWRWVLVVGRAYHDEGRIAGMYGIVQDISDKKQAEAALRSSEERFRHITQLSPALMWFSEGQGEAGFVNAKWSDYTGLAEEALLGKGWQSTVHPDDIARHLAYFDDCIARGEPYEVEVRYRRHDGEYRWHLARAVPLKGSGGSVQGYFGTAADIHESKTLREQLRLTNERLLMAHQAGRSATWEWNLRTQEVLWTDMASARSLFGSHLPDKNPVGWDEWMGIMPAEDHPSAFAQIAEALPRGEGLLEFRVPIDGQYYWFEARGRVVETDGAGIPVMIMGVTSDITERKKREQHHLLLINELNHRVKNTLATVQSLSMQSFRTPAPPDEAQASFTLRLMALARAHDVLTRESWEGANLEDIVKGALEPYRDLPGQRLKVAGPRLRLKPQPALAVAMAFHELATNAVKYGALSSDTGHVSIVWDVEDADEGQRLRIVWTEQDGPSVAPPPRKGFGSRLIENGVAGELNGHAQIEYRSEGIVCTIEAVL